MTSEKMLAQIRECLGIKDDTQDTMISDVILEVCDYCNLSPEHIPDALELFVRKKAKGIIDYEDAVGTGYQPEVAAIKEGDGSITWAQTDGNTKASIYGLSETDKRALRRHRRLRGYVKPICGNV